MAPLFFKGQLFFVIGLMVQNGVYACHCWESCPPSDCRYMYAVGNLWGASCCACCYTACGGERRSLRGGGGEAGAHHREEEEKQEDYFPSKEDNQPCGVCLQSDGRGHATSRKDYLKASKPSFGNNKYLTQIYRQHLGRCRGHRSMALRVLTFPSLLFQLTPPLSFLDRNETRTSTSHTMCFFALYTAIASCLSGFVVRSLQGDGKGSSLLHIFG